MKIYEKAIGCLSRYLMVIGCRAGQYWRTSILSCTEIWPPVERSLRDLCEREVNGKKRSISQMGRWSKEEHSLRALCHLEVTGKKRSERVFKRWSSKHNWQERVATYDADVERAAYQELLAQRQAEVEAFIEEDMAISLKFQKLCSTKKSSSVRNRLSRAKKNLKTWAIAWEEAYTEGYDLKFSEFMENQKKKK